MSPPMQAPRNAWVLATLGSVVLLIGLSLLSSAPLDTLGIDLRHRWVAFSSALSSRSATQAAGEGAPQVGMNVFLEQEVEPDKRQRSLELLRAAGVSWIRQELPWEQIEPVARGQTVDPNFGGSTWAKFDDIVDRASALGMHLVLRLDTSPRWALPADAPDGLSPPLEYADYWDFVGQVAARYRGRVAAYQIWNEPNLTSEWGRRPMSSFAPPAVCRANCTSSGTPLNPAATISNTAIRAWVTRLPAGSA